MALRRQPGEPERAFMIMMTSRVVYLSKTSVYGNTEANDLCRKTTK